MGRRDKWLRVLGSNIRNAREKKGLSQEALASRCQSHRNYIGGVERGERNPTASKIIAIALALDCSVAQLFRGLNPSDLRRDG